MKLFYVAKKLKLLKKKFLQRVLDEKRVGDIPSLKLEKGDECGAAFLIKER
jgi:hypothetical protein